MIKPSCIILAFPIGTKKSLSRTSYYTSKAELYMTSLSRQTTGFGSLIEAFNNPLASSESYGATVIKPGTLLYQAPKHWECWAPTANAGPLQPLKTIGHSISFLYIISSCVLLFYIKIRKLFLKQSTSSRHIFSFCTRINNMINSL